MFWSSEDSIYDINTVFHSPSFWYNPVPAEMVFYVYFYLFISLLMVLKSYPNVCAWEYFQLSNMFHFVLCSSSYDFANNEKSSTYSAVMPPL